MTKNLTWIIAGSDSSACAGIQADLKTMHALGVEACTVITAVTSQNQSELCDIHYVPPQTIATQISALKNTGLPAAIKIGMLGQAELMDFLAHYPGWVVLDPVMISTSGKQLFQQTLPSHLEQLSRLFPFVDVLTPNIPEAENILQHRLQNHHDIEQAAQAILSLGIKSVLIKGGHIQDNLCQDYWSDGKQSLWLRSPRQIKTGIRGTGCTLSSALTAALALGFDINDALIIAKMYINQGLRRAEEPHFFHAGWPENEIDLPIIHTVPAITRNSHQTLPFPDCGLEALGLYPIVDSISWLEKLLPLGVKTIQLRIKDKQGIALENEIKQGIALAKKYHARLFINDFWEFALTQGAYGVHLGQEDLQKADIEKIRQAGLRLGISTHNYAEVTRAYALRPSYIACGPIFATTSKAMPHPPQGILALGRWRRTLSCPLVAIGGINLENSEQVIHVLNRKSDGIALISGITQAMDPTGITKKLLQIIV